MSKNFDENQNNEIISGLQALGLKEKEALTYLALLELGEVGSSKIILKTGLHGQFIYQALSSLEKKGLIQHVIKRGRKKFSAKNPKTLARLVERQKTLADSITEKLFLLFSLPPEQNFEVFQGSESYIAHEFDMLHRAKEESELLIIGGSGDAFNEVMQFRLHEYTALQLKKHITMRYIGSENQRQAMSKLHGARKNFIVRYLPGLFTGQVNTNVWPDALGFNIFGDPITRFTLYSPVVAGSYRQFFETLWKLAKI